MSSLFHYFLVILFFINNYGKEHKMLKKRPIANCVINFLYVVEMCANLFLIISFLFIYRSFYLYIDHFIFI